MIKWEYRKIFKYCLTSKETDCIKLINKVMDMEKVPIHGPVHHFIMPAILLTCYHNATDGDMEKLKQQLIIAAKRAATVPGGNCASCGACGAALGFGQFASIVSENDPYQEENWSKVMEIVSLCSLEISKHGGPRCCKRDAYITLITGTREIERLLGIKITANKPMCKYFPKNEQCRKDECLFYPKSGGQRYVVQ